MQELTEDIFLILTGFTGGGHTHSHDEAAGDHGHSHHH